MSTSDSTRFTRKIFWLLAGAAVVQLIWIRSQLPETVASHFDASGNADGWMSRDDFILVMAAVDLLMAGVFGLTARLPNWLPSSLINLPNKEYWLAEERREASLDRFSGWMYRMGIVSMLFVMAVSHHILLKNIADGPGLAKWFWIILTAYMGMLTALIILMIRDFSGPPGKGGRDYDPIS